MGLIYQRIPATAVRSVVNPYSSAIHTTANHLQTRGTRRTGDSQLLARFPQTKEWPDSVHRKELSDEDVPSLSDIGAATHWVYRVGQ